jgi:hypothetical protein
MDIIAPRDSRHHAEPTGLRRHPGMDPLFDLPQAQDERPGQEDTDLWDASPRGTRLRSRPASREDGPAGKAR